MSGGPKLCPMTLRDNLHLPFLAISGGGGRGVPFWSFQETHVSWGAFLRACLSVFWLADRRSKQLSKGLIHFSSWDKHRQSSLACPALINIWLVAAVHMQYQYASLYNNTAVCQNVCAHVFMYNS